MKGVLSTGQVQIDLLSWSVTMNLNNSFSNKFSLFQLETKTRSTNKVKQILKDVAFNSKYGWESVLEV